MCADDEYRMSFAEADQLEADDFDPIGGK